MALSIPELPAVIARPAEPPWESGLALKIPMSQIEPTIDPALAVGISRHITSLNDHRYLRKYPVLYPRGVPKHKRQLHLVIVAGYSCWYKNLHCIKWYNSLSNEHQLLVDEKLEAITTPALRRELMQNRKYLMANRMRLINPQLSKQRLTSRQKEKEEQYKYKQLENSASAQSKRLVASGRVEGIINNNLTDGKCRKCGWERDGRIVAQFEKKTKTVVAHTTCVQCEQKIAQQHKELIRNEHLQNMFKAHLASRATPSTESECFVHVRKTVELNLLDDTEANPEVKSRLNELLHLLPSEPLLVKVMNVQSLYRDASEYNAARTNIEGASWSRREGESDEHMTIKHDGNAYDVTFVQLGQPLTPTPNFVILQNIDANEVDVSNISRQEQTRIDRGVTASRPGPSGGILQVGEKTSHYGPATRRKSSIFYPSTRSVSLKAIYCNPFSNKIINTSWGYKNAKMTILNPRQRYKEAKACTSYNNYLLLEAVAYINSVCCIMSVGVASRHRHIFEDLKKCLLNKSYNTIQEVLVAWMCNMEEIRNHQPNCCHCDGNPSQGYELLTMFPRIRRNGKRYNTPGRLYFPLHGQITETAIGNQVMCSNLTAVPHAADHSRATRNWSKASGYKSKS